MDNLLVDLEATGSIDAVGDMGLDHVSAIEKCKDKLEARHAPCKAGMKEMASELMGQVDKIIERLRRKNSDLVARGRGVNGIGSHTFLALGG